MIVRETGWQTDRQTQSLPLCEWVTDSLTNTERDCDSDSQNCLRLTDCVSPKRYESSFFNRFKLLYTDILLCRMSVSLLRKEIILWSYHIILPFSMIWISYHTMIVLRTSYQLYYHITIIVAALSVNSVLLVPHKAKFLSK